MGIESVSDIIAFGAKELNIDLPPDAGAAFETYCDFLNKRNESVNLTAIHGAGDTARLHFLDSLALLLMTNFQNAKVIDIGSGAGFPGIPLKIAAPSLELTVLDATEKRVNFLTELCALINLKASCIHARAEEAAHLHAFREQFDIVVSRAVAGLSILCELCLPYVKTGGLFIAMKGIGSDSEINEAKIALDILGAETMDCVDYNIPGTDIMHRAVLIKKVAVTPDKYPRRFASIKKKPLQPSN